MEHGLATTRYDETKVSKHEIQMLETCPEGTAHCLENLLLLAGKKPCILAPKNAQKILPN